MANKQDPPHRLGYRISQRLIRSVFKVLFGLRTEGLKNIPQSGPFILASNHQSFFDPPIVGSSCTREVFFAAKKELFSMFLIGTFVKYHNSIPVTRSGYDRNALRMLGEALDKGYGITIFPEGTRHIDGRLRPPKAGVGMLAVKHQVPIVPVYVRGSNILNKQILKRGLRVYFGTPFNIDLEKERYENEKELYRDAARCVMVRIAETGGISPPE